MTSVSIKKTVCAVLAFIHRFIHRLMKLSHQPGAGNWQYGRVNLTNSYLSLRCSELFICFFTPCNPHRFKRNMSFCILLRPAVMISFRKCNLTSGLILELRDNKSRLISEFRDDKSDSNPFVLTSTVKRSYEVVLLAVSQKWPVLLYGPTGSGKSALVNNLAKESGNQGNFQFVC